MGVDRAMKNQMELFFTIVGFVYFCKMKQSVVKTALSYFMKYGVPLIITVGLCYLLLTGVDVNEMSAIIRDYCNYWWIVLALVISVFSHVFRAMRWSIQLKALGIKVPLFVLTLSIFGTYAVNLVLPRLGELWRTTYIAQRQKAPFTEVFGSMVAERLADTVTVALLTATTFVLAGSVLGDYLAQNSGLFEKVIALMSSPWLWTGVVFVVAGVVALFCLLPDNKLIKKIKEFSKGLWAGFAVIATMPEKGRWLLFTLCIWGCYFMQLFVAFFAFPAAAQVVHDYGALAVLVCFVLSSIAMGVPSNGGLGPWQYAIVWGLGIYASAIPELSYTYRVSFANLVMGSQTLLLIVLGIFTFVCIAVGKRRASKKIADVSGR